MTYTWREIEESWLGGPCSLATPPDEVVTAFNQVADRFGRDWVEALRISNGTPSRGSMVTLEIVSLVRLLEGVDQLPNSTKLLKRIEQRDPDTRAELVAAYMLRTGNPAVLVEVEPEVQVGTYNPKPDFRARIANEPWTYIEAKNPNKSEPEGEIQAGLAKLTGLVNECAGSYALEVFLKRDPTETELDSLAAQIKARYSVPGTATVELQAGLGTLYWNWQAPGIIAPDSHGEPYTPRLSRAGVIAGNGEHRHIMVRWPFTDSRTEHFLRRKARQLSTDAPGMLMIYAAGTIGAMKAWRNLITPRFQPNIHTRVSAVCLYTSIVTLTDEKQDSRIECKLILNPYARFPLPEWITTQLERFPSREQDI